MGRMINPCCCRDGAFASTSANKGTRAPVVKSITWMGLVVSVEAARLPCDGSDVGVTPWAKYTRI
jgi:hypothetical protein